MTHQCVSMGETQHAEWESMPLGAQPLLGMGEELQQVELRSRNRRAWPSARDGIVTLPVLQRPVAQSQAFRIRGSTLTMPSSISQHRPFSLSVGTLWSLAIGVRCTLFFVLTMLCCSSLCFPSWL